MNDLVPFDGSRKAAIVPAVSMPELLQRFAAYIQVKEVTAKSYGVALRCFADWMRDNGITGPNRADIIKYAAYLAEPHRRRARSDRPGSSVDPAVDEFKNRRRARSDRPGSPAGNVITFSAGTQARYLRAVKLLFKWASLEGLYPNIADNVKGAVVHADNQKRDPLERNDALKLLKSIDRSTITGKRDYAMILLSITCGLRIIEMQRANIGNIETVNGEPVLFVQGKGHDEADAYKKLTPEVKAAIDDYLGYRIHVNKDSPLFAGAGNRSSGRLAEPSISRIIKTRLQAAGYNTHRITAHSLRHTSVTFLLEAGATIQEAQFHARHASPETTGIYAHNLKQKKVHTEQRIYNYLFGVELDAATQAADCMKRMTQDQQEQALAILRAMASN